MRRTIVALFVTLLPACSALAIDLTPRAMLVNADGVVVRRTYFTDGDKKYGIKVSADTDLAPGNGGALFTFSKFIYATMTWRQSPLTPAIPFDATHLPQYSAAAMQLLPKGSAKIQVEGEEANVFPINHWICHRYTISYSFYGYPMQDTVTFLNLNDSEQFVIQVSARRAEFSLIAAQSWDIIRTWHEMDSRLEPTIN